ncbi:MAG: XRE family transcriptional regulator [Rhodospirillum sp.]|nr:XRE family transcriptional regulator [Rhodospirillum sp.]
MSGLAMHTSIARLRAELEATQTAVAEKAGLDQSRVSRIEKGEVVDRTEVDRVLDALTELGSANAAEYKAFAAREWSSVEPPSFWNPQRACIEIAEETLGKIETFLADEDRPWPLRRQIERHRGALLHASTFLTRLNHNIAFIGDIGVGKSTAISFIFELLVPPSLADKPINRPILETGAGGTTICEVHVKGGPEFGLSLQPMSDSEVRSIVSDFCAAKWALFKKEQEEAGETVGVSREVDRAIRNMSGLVRRRETIGGKITYKDPIQDLAISSGTEEEFRTRLLAMMNLAERTRRELWYDSSTRQHPMEWVMDAFKSVNNGRLKDVSLPRSIDLLVPNFGRSFGELEITVIDTKGVDDVAIREDLDLRLKDGRTAVVFCSRFNDAPGMSTRALLQHMQQTFSERVDTGKVAILALPRAEEARATKDDIGEQVMTDAEGYELKKAQVLNELTADGLSGVPMIFYNVVSDDVSDVRDGLFNQLSRIRRGVEEHLFDLCAAAQDIIESHEAHALNAAIEEVANRLSNFLKGNRPLGARERLAYEDALNTVRGVRYASTLWASARRNGEYSGLNILHQVGVGAARDARSRSEAWFKGFDAFLKSLKADDGLKLATRSIGQIGASAEGSKTAFLEAAQSAGMEVYREPLTQASVWSECVDEWGRGPGFKMRVAGHLEQWFASRPDLKETLEKVVCGLWDEYVVMPLLRLSEETSPAPAQKELEGRRRGQGKAA